MAVTLYGFIVSPPLRATMMTCEALGVEYMFKVLDVVKFEHHEPEYLKVRTNLQCSRLSLVVTFRY